MTLGPLELAIILLFLGPAIGGVVVAIVAATRRSKASLGTGPQPELLANGDVMVPGEGGRMVRIAVGEPRHEEWVAYIQQTSRRR